MIRYRYATHRAPPAPFVNVTLRCAATGTTATVAAQLDTGADRTVLPGNVVEALGLVEDGRMQFQGFAGAIVELPLFLVELRIENLPELAIRAVLGDAEPHVLLGRDVLNGHRLLLDGPGLMLDSG